MSIAEKNDAMRRSVFSQALEDRVYELDGPYVHRSGVILNLSMDVSGFQSDVKRKLFDACLNLIESTTWEPNTFNYANDPDGAHDLAKIRIEGAPDCFMKIDARIITLFTVDEY